MSLNRSEQRVLDYLESQAEEKKYWVGRVQSLSGAEPDPHAVAHRLEQELWRYYKERSEIVPHFREAARAEGLERTSLRSLAEYLIRLWTTPRPKSRSESARLS